MVIPDRGLISIVSPLPPVCKDQRSFRQLIPLQVQLIGHSITYCFARHAPHNSKDWMVVAQKPRGESLSTKGYEPLDTRGWGLSGFAWASKPESLTSSLPGYRRKHQVPPGYMSLILLHVRLYYKKYSIKQSFIQYFCPFSITHTHVRLHQWAESSWMI